LKAYSVIYESKFWLDFDEATDWYANISLSLVLRFRDEMFKKIYKTSLNPFAYRKFAKSNHRRILFDNFPYKIIYRLEEDKVYILALIHNSRSNKFISKKLK
jgi:plasmid stabilization system protein ParE